MGHRKRIAAPRSKQSPATAPGADASEKADAEATAAKNDGLIESGASSHSVVKQECERALTSLRKGNHTKALRLMKESCTRYESLPQSALTFRVQGTVCIKVAAIIDDLNAKQRHLRNAIDSARKAVELSPNSIEFAHFYANLLYDAANEAKEYEEVVTECERALAIENPIDPAKESLQEESQQKIVNADGRILHVQGELRNLIQKANFASISSWMKNFGGDEKLRLIPIRGRVAEDPMEPRSVQARRPNEIRKATKTAEERRKEIEVRVAAARLLQQQSETAGPQSGGGDDKGVDSSLGNGVKTTSERRKHGKKNETSSDRKAWARSYWNSLTSEKKKEWVLIRVCDLKGHFAFSKDGGLVNDVFSEAVEHAAASKTWKYWKCCNCNMKFSDSECHLQHAIHEHIGNIFPKLQSSLPQNIDKEWAEMIYNCSWKPLDVSAALEMHASQQKCPDEDFSLGHNDECDDCFRDAWDSSPEKDDSRGYNCSGVMNDGHSGHVDDQGLVRYSSPETWPMSHDPERAKLLERIHTLFEVLIRHKCLSEGHLAKVLQFTIDELQGLCDGSQILNLGVNHTPQCICFLGAEQLRKIIKFLQEISGSCGLGRYPEKSSRPVDDANVQNQGEEINEKILLNEDASCILLDESLLPIECEPANCHDSDVAGHDPAKVAADADSLLSWMYSGSSCTELLASWTQRKDEIARNCSENFNMLEKESIALQDMCNRKSQLIGYEEALQVLEELCIEESKRRENGDEFAQRSHGSVLKKRAEEIRAEESDFSFNSSRFESEVIKNILKNAETINANQFGYDDAYGGMASQLRDLEAAGDEDWRAKEYLQQADTCIEVSFQKQKEETYMEMCKLDTRIMRSVNQLRQLELKFEAGAALDYRWVLVPVAKLYMRTHLEDLAEKDAMEKSDAAREAFLAELALDSSKAVRGGNDLKHGQEKTKDKKRHKKTKAGGINEPDTVYHGTDELESFTSDGGHPDCEVVSSLDVDEFKEEEEEEEEEEELRRIELEAEVRKLEETLEYQRRMENEAKQRQLSEQHKKLDRAYLVNGRFADVDTEPRTDDQPTSPQLKTSVQLVQKNDQPNSSDGISEDARLAILVPNGSSTIYETWKTKTADHAEVKKEDDVIPSDKRTGRRGRRQRSSTKLQGQASPSGMEHVESRSPSQVQSQHANDNEGKTLRQLHVEEDDEERFQADLKKAVRQSLDTLQAHRKLPSPAAMTPRTVEPTDQAVKTDEILAETDGASDMFGTGLQNEVGEYNCFLNVIIQSLWHIRRFRSEFLKSSRLDHSHVGDPCVVCALREIFTALNAAAMDARKEPVAPSSLRIALSNLYPDSNFFQEGQMNDASEVLAVIFDCLHKSFTDSASDNESVQSSSIGSWDCKNCKACPVHSLFGMDIFERMDCSGCGLESRHLKYMSFFHNINASALRTMKLTSAESSFDELLNLAEMNHQLACDPEAGGCGKLNHIHHFLSNPPHVFTTVLGWQKTCESADDIAATLAALNTNIDMSILYRGLDPKHVHNLVSVVCYYGQHYHCFAYSHDLGRWIMYDDRTVKVIGKWEDVLSMCDRGHLQPQVLFFEYV